MKTRVYGGEAWIDDQGSEEGENNWLEEFEEADLIEARVQEIISMERDLAAYLRTLGVPDVRVVLDSLEESPFVRICEGLDLDAEEVSELISRLDPKWNDRCWEGLPTDDTIELLLAQQRGKERKEKEVEEKKQREEERLCQAREVTEIKREARRQRRQDDATQPQPQPLSRPEPQSQRSSKAAAARTELGRAPEDPSVCQRQDIAAAIAAMRAKNKAKG